MVNLIFFPPHLRSPIVSIYVLLFLFINLINICTISGFEGEEDYELTNLPDIPENSVEYRSFDDSLPINDKKETPTIFPKAKPSRSPQLEIPNEIYSSVQTIPPFLVSDDAENKAIIETEGQQSAPENREKNSSPTLFHTNEGQLRGKFIDVPGGERIVIFCGVPYAAPPIRNLRFKPPHPLEAWESERTATELGPMCAQFNPVTKNTSGEEDCLYLNIFAPIPKGKEKLPVMVFIHGGFFVSGSGNNYPAYQLASRYRVIVITINYRLGVFGFLRFDDTSKSCSNCGILDQIAALTWIRDNVPNIGGNPDRVTVVGQGSGATCVKLLLTVPRARGLFDTAIAQGGSLATLEEAREPKLVNAVEFIARESQCPNTQDTNAILECLRNMPAETLLRISGRFCSVDNQNYLSHPFQPSVEQITGHKAVGENFEEMMSKIPLNTDTLLIAGINSAEGVIPYYPPLLPEESFNVSDAGNLEVSPESFENKVVPQVLHSHNYPHDEASLKQAAAFAYMPWAHPKDPVKLADSALQMSGDQHFTIPYLRDLKYFAKSHKKLYAYLFNYASKSKNAPEFARVPWFSNGTARGSELVYIFGYPTTKRTFLETTPHNGIIDSIPGYEKNHHYALADVGMSEFMMETWANIAKTRKPNLSIGKWPRVKPDELNHLVIADMGKTGPVLYSKRDYKAMQSYFWDKFYPNLEKEIKKEEAAVAHTAQRDSPRCLTYKRATWGILGTLLLIGIFWAILKLIRHFIRKRRHKYSSTPINPNNRLVYN